MQKLVIAVLAAGVVTLTACDPDTGSGSSELRRNTPNTTSVAPTTTERPRLRLPDLRLPIPAPATESATPTTTPK
ncbi:hypothetical protein [Nocardia blacklockiae]|uniref:hypothetical protein n=1 Tax=Nocardia blacklockiae TaxID=480036 RepID=UPI0018956361|nr:hypothetical protein [Nocardia blacklockiae]MBF6175370.1 hypothetical protein [Nocardia blacklockiae]